MKAQTFAPTRRRGASVLELMTSIAILGLVLTIIAQCTLSGGRAFRETRRRDHALELCNRALEHVAARDAREEESLAEIAKQVSDSECELSLALDGSHVTATAAWENDIGVTHSLQLHAWLPAQASAEGAP